MTGYVKSFYNIYLDSLRYDGYGDMPPVYQTQNLVRGDPRVGSSPTAGKLSRIPFTS